MATYNLRPMLAANKQLLGRQVLVPVVGNPAPMQAQEQTVQTVGQAAGQTTGRAIPSQASTTTESKITNQANLTVPYPILMAARTTPGLPLDCRWSSYGLGKLSISEQLFALVHGLVQAQNRGARCILLDGFWIASRQQMRSSTAILDLGAMQLSLNGVTQGVSTTQASSNGQANSKASSAKGHYLLMDRTQVSRILADGVPEQWSDQPFTDKLSAKVKQDNNASEPITETQGESPLSLVSAVYGSSAAAKFLDVKPLAQAWYGQYLHLPAGRTLNDLFKMDPCPNYVKQLLLQFRLSRAWLESQMAGPAAAIGYINRKENSDLALSFELHEHEQNPVQAPLSALIDHAFASSGAGQIKPVHLAGKSTYFATTLRHLHLNERIKTHVRRLVAAIVQRMKDAHADALHLVWLPEKDYLTNLTTHGWVRAQPYYNSSGPTDDDDSVPYIYGLSSIEYDVVWTNYGTDDALTDILSVELLVIALVLELSHMAQNDPQFIGDIQSIGGPVKPESEAVLVMLDRYLDQDVERLWTEPQESSSQSKEVVEQSSKQSSKQSSSQKEQGSTQTKKKDSPSFSSGHSFYQLNEDDDNEDKESEDLGLPSGLNGFADGLQEDEDEDLTRLFTRKESSTHTVPKQQAKTQVIQAKDQVILQARAESAKQPKQAKPQQLLANDDQVSSSEDGSQLQQEGQTIAQLQQKKTQMRVKQFAGALERSSTTPLAKPVVATKALYEQKQDLVDSVQNVLLIYADSSPPYVEWLHRTITQASGSSLRQTAVGLKLHKLNSWPKGGSEAAVKTLLSKISQQEEKDQKNQQIVLAISREYDYVTWIKVLKQSHIPFGLLHLGDDRGTDNVSIYDTDEIRFIWRHHIRLGLSSQFRVNKTTEILNKIRLLPLGCSMPQHAIGDLNERRFKFAFTGQLKGDRRLVLETFQKTLDLSTNEIHIYAFEHNEWHGLAQSASQSAIQSNSQTTGKRLSPSEYWLLLYQADFVYCPGPDSQTKSQTKGSHHTMSPETCRLYDALEAGAIPVVLEKKLLAKDGSGAHRRLAGGLVTWPSVQFMQQDDLAQFSSQFSQSIPFLVGSSWSELAQRVKSMLANPKEIIEMREACQAWYRQYKQAIQRLCRQDLESLAL